MDEITPNDIPPSSDGNEPSEAEKIIAISSELIAALNNIRDPATGNMLSINDIAIQTKTIHAPEGDIHITHLSIENLDHQQRHVLENYLSNSRVSFIPRQTESTHNYILGLKIDTLFQTTQAQTFYDDFAKPTQSCEKLAKIFARLFAETSGYKVEPTDTPVRHSVKKKGRFLSSSGILIPVPKFVSIMDSSTLSTTLTDLGIPCTTATLKISDPQTTRYLSVHLLPDEALEAIEAIAPEQLTLALEKNKSSRLSFSLRTTGEDTAKITLGGNLGERKALIEAIEATTDLKLSSIIHTEPDSHANIEGVNISDTITNQFDIRVTYINQQIVIKSAEKLFADFVHKVDPTTSENARPVCLYVTESGHVEITISPDLQKAVIIFFNGYFSSIDEDYNIIVPSTETDLSDTVMITNIDLNTIYNSAYWVNSESDYVEVARGNISHFQQEQNAKTESAEKRPSTIIGLLRSVVGIFKPSSKESETER